MEKKLKEYSEILEIASDVLEMYENLYERLEDISFEDFYDDIDLVLGIGRTKVKEKYEEAMSTTKTGYVIVLKRTVQERWTNNYHPLWMVPWNANMDIQIGKFMIVE